MVVGAGDREHPAPGGHRELRREHPDAAKIPRVPRQTRACPQIFEVQSGNAIVTEDGGVRPDLRLDPGSDAWGPVGRGRRDKEGVAGLIAPRQGRIACVKNGGVGGKEQRRDLYLVLENGLSAEAVVV